MVTRDDVLKVIKAELEGSESYNSKYINWFNKNVLKTWSFPMNVTLSHIWTSWVAFDSGLTEEQVPYTANCDEGINWFRSNKRFSKSTSYGGGYNPIPGDWIYYSYTNSLSDCTHVGIVLDDDGNLLKVVELQMLEGFKSNIVCRDIYIHNPYIIGYGIPNYKNESKLSILSLAGTGVATGIAKTSFIEVKEGDAEHYKTIGRISWGDSVEILGLEFNGWLKIVWAYSDTGFAYVSNVDNRHFSIVYNSDNVFKQAEISVGSIVNFIGRIHYSSPMEEVGSPCTSGKARVTQKYKFNGLHTYHLIAERGEGSNVYGWVDTKDILASVQEQTGYNKFTGRVNALILNVRVGPGIKYSKLQSWPQLVNGNIVDVLGEAKTDDTIWYYVNILGNCGYVHNKYIVRI